MVHEMSPTARLCRSWPPIIPERGGTGGTGHIRGHTTVRTRLDMVGSARRHACPRQQNRPKAISHLYFHTGGVADGSALFQQLLYPPVSVLGGSASISFKWVYCSGICGSCNASPGGRCTNGQALMHRSDSPGARDHPERSSGIRIYRCSTHTAGSGGTGNLQIAARHQTRSKAKIQSRGFRLAW